MDKLYRARIKLPLGDNVNRQFYQFCGVDIIIVKHDKIKDSYSILGAKDNKSFLGVKEEEVEIIREIKVLDDKELFQEFKTKLDYVYHTDIEAEEQRAIQRFGMLSAIYVRSLTMEKKNKYRDMYNSFLEWYKER